MRMMFPFLKVLVVSVLLFVAPARAAKQAEVIHWWVSGGESAAMQVLIDAFEKQGYDWVDTPVGASFEAKTVALNRMFDGAPPTAVQWHVGVTVADLHSLGLLRDVDQLAQRHGWREALPQTLHEYITVEGKMVAAPLTLHGQNWLFASKKVLDDAGLSMPTSWEEFIKALETLKKDGVIPLALGGQPWQVNLLFLNTLLALEGADFYHKVLIEHDQSALNGAKMVNVFRKFGELKQYVDPKSFDRGWAATTELLIKGKAGFQVMGDWAKGEFLHAGLTPGKDILCELTPGTAPYYMATSDALALTAVTEPDDIEAQHALVKLVMDPELQRLFNLKKGAIPPRLDASTEGFDLCARKAMAVVKNQSNVLPGTNMANKEIITSAFLDIVFAFWSEAAPAPEKAAQRLAKAIQEVSF